MCERFVGIGHFVRVFFLLDGRPPVAGRIQKFSS
jgi:hypothetical protein